MHFPKRWRLKRFLFVILLSFNALFLLLLSASIYFSVSYVITERTSETKLELLGSNLRQLTEYIGQIEETSVAISTHSLLKESLEKQPTDLYDSLQQSRKLTDWINNYMFIKPYVTSIQIYSDILSTYPVTGQRVHPLKDIQWGAELAKFQQVDSFWIPTRTDKYGIHGPATVITHAMKIADLSGKVFGYVEINVSNESLNRMFGNFGSQKASKATFILDSEQRQIALVSTMDGFGDPRSQSARRPRLDNISAIKNAGFGKDRLGDSSYLYIYTDRQDGAWRLVQFIPEEEVYRNTHLIRNLMLAIGIVSLLLAFPLASYLADRIIRPVSALLRRFEAIEEGDLSTRMDRYFIEEFHIMSHGFNKMIRRLTDLLDQHAEEQRQKQDAELRVLQSQINPHFLYNTLDMINWMAAMKGAPDVSEMAAQLAKLFRIGLSKGRDFITLKEELDHGMAYMQIQQTRFENKFIYTEQVDPCLKRSLVPKIIIQPFIENSIIHGFSDETDEKAVIAVRSEIKDEQSYTLIIEDNGTGMNVPLGEELEREKMKRVSPYAMGTSGYGVRNVHERIRMYFGDAYGVVLSNLDSGGVRVEITLPWIEDEERILSGKGRKSSREGSS